MISTKCNFMLYFPLGYISEHLSQFLKGTVNRYRYALIMPRSLTLQKFETF